MDTLRELGGPQDRLVADELERLKALPFDRLVAMDDSATTTLGGGNASVRAVVWRDLLEDGRVRIVVQTLSLAGGCCVADLNAYGFIMSPDGTITPVPDDMMYEFRLCD